MQGPLINRRLWLCGEQITFVENPAGYLTAQFEKIDSLHFGNDGR